MKTVISLILLPLKLTALFVRLAVAVTRSVLGGAIRGCLAPLGLLTLLAVAVFAIIVL